MDSGLDSAGFIRSIDSVELQPEFEALVKAGVSSLVESIDAADLHSIYLYGSIASARAKLQASDLDMLVVFSQSVSSESKRKISSIEQMLGRQYSSVVRDAGIAAASIEEVFCSGNQVGWGCFIKHMCRNLHGEDLGLLFPPFRPSRTVVYGLNDDLFRQMENFSKANSAGASSGTGSRDAMALARKLIRASFGLVIEECDYWTTDLQRCADTFCKYYPAEAEAMRQTLLIAQGKSTGMLDAIEIETLCSFGNWLCGEFELRVLPFRLQDRLVNKVPAHCSNAADG